MGKKVVLILAVVLLLFGVVQPVGAQPSLSINGQAAVLLDAQSKQVLYENNKDEKLPPASITKILTTIMAIESGKLDETVTIGPNPPLLEGTRVYLEEGEKIKLRELVIASLVNSANDAALAIAEYLGGTEEKFAQAMNERARELGARNSNFVNAHGLSAENHYTTAYDMGVIACYAMQNETFREIVKMKVYDWEGQAWQTRLINKNEMLWSYKGANGIKTGYTKEAKCTIVASAARDGQEFIAVVLGSVGNNTWTDAEKVLDYGFANFRKLQLAKPDEVAARVQFDPEEKKELLLATGQELTVTVPLGANQKVESHVVLNPLGKKVEKGQVSGKMEYYVDGEQVGSVDLIARNSLVLSSRPYFEYVLFVIAGIYLCQIMWRIYQRYRMGRRYNLFASRRSSRYYYR
mgnify:CR=1 FL=1